MKRTMIPDNEFEQYPFKQAMMKRGLNCKNCDYALSCHSYNVYFDNGKDLTKCRCHLGKWDDIKNNKRSEQ
jgi:hypothetical protein